MKVRGYQIEVRALRAELGGGFVAFAPELMGCVADGESQTVALLNLEDAMQCWIEEAGRLGRPIPSAVLEEA